MSACQYTSQHFFSNTGRRIFLKFYIKLDSLECQKSMKPDFSEKNYFRGKSPKSPPKYVFLYSAKNSFH